MPAGRPDSVVAVLTEKEGLVGEPWVPPRGATMPGRMSRVCAICGKKPATGNNRSHSMVATKRRFNPNLQRVRLVLDGKPTRDYVCTRCLKAGKVIKAV